MKRPDHKLNTSDVLSVLNNIIELYGEKPEGIIYDLMTEILSKLDIDTLTLALEDTIRLWDLNNELSPNYGLDEDDPDYDPEIGEDFDYIESVTGVKAK